MTSDTQTPASLGPTARREQAAFRIGVVASVVVTIVGLAAIAGWTVYQWQSTHYHYAMVQGGVLYRDGFKSAKQFDAALKRARIKTDVSLVDEREQAKPPLDQEQAVCARDGVELVRIPVTLGGWPNGDQVKQFLAIATDPAHQPVIVHCAQGVRRTGMMVAAYQESVLHWDAAKTKSSVLAFGHSERTTGDIKTFIDDYDPQAQVMTKKMEPSSE